MHTALFLSTLLLAIAAGDAMARHVEASGLGGAQARGVSQPPPRDCIAIGHASVESITTESLARGRQVGGNGYVHVAALRNRLARPLEVTVNFEAPETSDATRDGVFTLPPRGLLRVRLGVTPVHRTDGELRATVSVRCMR